MRDVLKPCNVESIPLDLAYNYEYCKLLQLEKICHI